MTNCSGMCDICFDETTDVLQASVHEKNPCSFRCCPTCVVTYLSIKIHEKDVNSSSLTCPGGCSEPLSQTDIQAILKNVKSDDDNNKGIELLLSYETAMQTQIKIESERNRRLNRMFPSVKETLSDIAFSCWSMSQNTRRCPGCRTLIEKNGGCQHMTCRSCKHEFWWCCGRAYSKGKHNEILCAPSVYMNHQHKLWGPNLPVRTITKTTVAGVGLGVGCAAVGVAAVAVPTFLVMEKIVKTVDKKAGLKKRRRIARQRRFDEHYARELRSLEEINRRDREQLAQLENRTHFNPQFELEASPPHKTNRNIDPLYYFDPLDVPQRPLPQAEEAKGFDYNAKGTPFLQYRRSTFEDLTIDDLSLNHPKYDEVDRGRI